MTTLSLEKIDDADGGDGALVLVSGYISDTETPRETDFRWWDGFRSAGWDGALYLLNWDASTPVSEHVLAPMPISLTLPGGAFAFIPADVAAGMGSAVLHWRKVRDRAEAIGREELLPFLDKKLDEDSVTLVGHSVGSRIVHFAMRAAADDGASLADVILCGGTESADEDWEAAMEGLEGNLLNVFHPRDRVLSFFERTFRSKRPVGLSALELEHDRAFDLDGSEIKPGEWRKPNHWIYRYVIEEACADLFAGTIAVQAAAS